MRPSWIEVDLDAVRHNVEAVAHLVEPSRVCAVVKADGYGHGEVPVADAAVSAGATMLAVALPEEGVRLREAGIEAPILLLSEPPLEDLADIVKWSITPTVYRHTTLEALADLGPVGVHVKADTGMHRVGAPPDVAFELALRLGGGALDATLEGLWTHFAVADEESPFTNVQIERFDELLERLERRGVSVPVTHLSNTAGALLHESARRDMVRLGLGMYGLYPSDPCREVVDLRPAMRVVTHVSYVRRLGPGDAPSYGRRRPLTAATTVVTAPIGYADGVPRLLSSRGGEVLVGGERRPFAGTVTMDQIVVDVGDREVDIGEEMVLIGSQGNQTIVADEWAKRTDTISYEIVTGMGARMPRRYGP